MAEAFIIDAVRTPVGRRGGVLSQAHPADLGAHVIRALVERTQIDPGVSWWRAATAARAAGLHLALKSGNFGGTDFFSRAFDLL